MKNKTTNKKIKLSKDNIKKMLDTEKKFLSNLSKNKVDYKQVESRTKQFLTFIKKFLDATIYTTLIINAISICIMIYLALSDPDGRNGGLMGIAFIAAPNIALFVFITLPSVLLKMLLKTF